MKKRANFLKVGVLLLLILSGCSEGLQEEVTAKAVVKKQRAVQTEIQIPVIKDFMPNMNFVPRSNIPTHIVLHFISNAASNHENPYIYMKTSGRFSSIMMFPPII